MRLAELLAHLEQWYDPAWAAPWDRVGLVCGDPEQEVRRVLLAVDPVTAVIDEALEWRADLVLVHHPLLLTPVSSVAATTAKGRVLSRLIAAGTALFTAHTNADVPAEGVNEALARAVGLRELQVLSPTEEDGLDKLVVFVPLMAVETVRQAITAAGGGALGAYDSCTFTGLGEGRFRPLAGARPAVGQVGDLEVVQEARVETVMPRALRSQVVQAMRLAHPYEEPAFDVLELGDAPGPAGNRQPRPTATRGHGRVGTLSAPMSLRDFAAQVATALPVTATGVRVAGDPAAQVRRVAVGAGSGDSLLAEVRRSGADVYVTSDLKHHRASEFLEDGGPALIDVAHWAAEWTWLPVVEGRLRSLGQQPGAGTGDTVSTRVSTVVTDPWSFRVRGDLEGES